MQASENLLLMRWAYSAIRRVSTAPVLKQKRVGPQINEGIDFLNGPETYGMLVRSEAEKVIPPVKIKVVKREDFLEGNHRGVSEEPEELRFLDKTLIGKYDSSQVHIPTTISKAIRNHIVKVNPHLKPLRRCAAEVYNIMEETGLHKIPSTPQEVDSHIATVFVQNYASISKALGELRAKLEEKGEVFSPKKVLDVGYGPSTGLVALNSFLGDSFYPEIKHSLITGKQKMIKLMRNKAKILLSRQLNEVNVKKYSPEMQRELVKETSALDEVNEDDEVYSVDANRISVNTKFIDEVGAKKYDLIILTHQLLKDTSEFPYSVDDVVQKFLNVLEPKGHLIIIERGNPLGFEIVARARQIMLRPESHSKYEYGKLPRPWIRGAKIKPRNQPVIEDHVEESGTELMEELNKKYGDVQKSDLEIEDTLAKDYDLLNDTDLSVHTDYYLTNIAPYPHHLKCPFQMKNPKVYDYPKGSKLNFLSFGASVERPPFSIEFKRGRELSAEWESVGEPKKGAASAGSGRANGNNYEQANFNYLIMERSKIDGKTLRAIEKERERVRLVTEQIEAAYEAGDNEIGDKLVSLEKQKHLESNDNSQHWAKIIKHPMKRKGHVIFQVMTFDGAVEKWVVPKSLGKAVFHDARKAQKGDQWAHDPKTRIAIYEAGETQYDKHSQRYAQYEIMEKKENKRRNKEQKKEAKIKEQEVKQQHLRQFSEEFFELK